MNNNMAAFSDQSPARGMRNQFNEFPHGQSQSGTSPTANPSFPRFPPPPRPPTDLGFFPGNSSSDTSPPFTPDSTFTRPPMFNSGIRTGNPEWQQHQRAPDGASGNYNGQQNPNLANMSPAEGGHPPRAGAPLGEAQQEFNDKLKRKSFSGDVRATFDHQMSSNLRNLTPVPVSAPVNARAALMQSPTGFPLDQSMQQRPRHQNFRSGAPYRMNFRPRGDFGRPVFRGRMPRVGGSIDGPPPLIRHGRPF